MNKPELPPDDGFSILKQKLHLDFSFFPRLVKGKATLEIQPKNEHLRYISLNCRQLRITRIAVDGHDATSAAFYANLYDRLDLYEGNDIYQYNLVKDRLRRHRDGQAPELEIVVPDAVKIRRMNPNDATADQIAANAFGANGEDLYTPIQVEIDYELENPRDGLHFVGVEAGDPRYPHVFTRNSLYPGSASCLFPCVDDGATKCIFDVSVRYPRTLGDLYGKHRHRMEGANGTMVGARSPKADSVMSDLDDDPELSDEERAMELAVICSGELTDDISDPVDASRKTASFACVTPVLPQHIGIAIGPFRHVDLSEYRDVQDDERLGSNAIRVHAFCLPGREDEVRNSALILARTLDSFTEKYQSYPFEKAYKLTFVDDLECDVAHSASFSICSSRLLFPETVWEPLDATTRTLVHAVASQWIGVNVTAARPRDYWVIVGASWFMAELYLQELFGRNDLRFRERNMVQRILELDVRRPSLSNLGEYLSLDPGETEFMELKAFMVLAILHHRLVKQSGKNGMDRCLYRMLFNARNEKLPDGMISTEAFLDICEKVGHQKLDAFFNQWVYGSGCPTFECHPVFNKKKQVIQLTIKQTQADPQYRTEDPAVAAEDVLRETKEKANGFRPSTEWPAFVGPMTIRIHEADGTPYEHIVDINSSTVKVEIPYNTKYKRLKKNRRERERQAAAAGLDASGETQEDTVFYMLGDLFETKEEMQEWRISEWSQEDENRMDQEFYEWLRVDADFEWICRANIIDMPAYMYVSQLQQDKDVMAQAESIQWLAGKEGHPLISSILLKTLMDERYFHGIRTMAAAVMANCATQKTNWIGLFHLKKAFQSKYCIPGSPMTRSNDFSDRVNYIIQCAIPRAIAQIKDSNGKAPMEVKRFLLDLVRYNDNRGNDYSDDHYIATLLKCLAHSLITIKITNSGTMGLGDLGDADEEFEFQRKALDELSRHQRLDEWIPTYRNIYTVTALECSVALMKNKVIPLVPSEFLQYTRVGSADNVRLKAWECLIQVGGFRNPGVMRFMMEEITHDPSPYFRASLLHLLEFALGQIAIGADFKLEEPKAQSAMPLQVIQTTEEVSDREIQFARRKLEGAQRALKAELAGNPVFKAELEKALHSKTTSIKDVAALLEICQLLYNAVAKLTVRLKYPRYWRAEHLGDGKMRFYHSNKYRTKPIKALQAASTEHQTQQQQQQQPPPTVLSLTLPVPGPLPPADLQRSIHTPSAIVPPAVPAVPPQPAPKLKLKVKLPAPGDKSTKPSEPQTALPTPGVAPPKPPTPKPLTTSRETPKPLPNSRETSMPIMSSSKPPTPSPARSPAPTVTAPPSISTPRPTPPPPVVAPRPLPPAAATPAATPFAPTPKPSQPLSQPPSRPGTPGLPREGTPGPMGTSKIKIRTVSKTSSGNKIVKPSKQERYDRPDKPDRQDRLERPDKLDRLERPDRPDRPDRPEKEKRSLVAKLRLPPSKLAALVLPPEQRGYKLVSSLNPSLKRKREAEGAPDGYHHSIKKQSFHAGINGFGGVRERESLIVRLKLGRERCRYVREKYRKRDGQ